MAMVNMHEAKTRLSALVEAVESGREAEVVIARNGKPAARLVAVETKRPARIGGLAKGKFRSLSLEELNRDEDEIAALFNDGPVWPDEDDR